MNITHGVEMLEISRMLMGNQITIHPTLLWDTDHMVLVDTGHPGQLPLFREETDKIGISLDKLDKIIITHQDIDHIGSLSTILEELPQQIEVLANEIEKPYIQGEKRLLRMTPETIANAMKALPSEIPDEQRKAFKYGLENPPKAKVDRIVEDGEELPYCCGIVIINTPGHTPGHISLYHKQSKTLIAGDALIVTDGQLLGPEPQYCLDASLAIKSLKKFIPYDIETVICYHGGVYNTNVNQRIVDLAKEE
jgi:glyoxylase-like metal-dependent hydrolase (beta-lactamase superfamily II)